MSKTSYAEVLTEWEQLLVTVEKNLADLPFLEEALVQLRPLFEGAKEARIRQKALKAQLQQATRDLEQFLALGLELATRLRNGIRTQYGLKGEKLTEFGLQPRRTPQKAKPEPVPQPAPASKTVVESNS